MFSPSNDVLTIRSNDPRATLLVNGNIIGKGVAQYTLPRGRSALITASQKGCQNRTIETNKSITPTTWLNIFFWPGFIIDVATGAIQRADPTAYTVTPFCH